MNDQLLAATPRSVLAIYAHPDDAEVSCGGALARWASEGAQVHLVIAAQGDKGSNDPAVRSAELVAERASEVTASAGIMGLASVINLGIPDGEVENTNVLRRSLVAALRRRRPDVVLCPDPTAVFFGDAYVNHHDHRLIGWAALDAVAPAAASRLYFPEDGEPHQVSTVLMSGTHVPDAWIDISMSLDAKVAALSSHRTQLGENADWAYEFLRVRAIEAGAAGSAILGAASGLRLAEGFRRIRLTR